MPNRKTKAESKGPIEKKVKAGHGVALVVGGITWALTCYVPVFSVGLSEPVHALIVWLVTLVFGAVAGFIAKHTHRPDLPPAVPRPRTVQDEPPPPTGL